MAGHRTIPRRHGRTPAPSPPAPAGVRAPSPEERARPARPGVEHGPPPSEQTVVHPPALGLRDDVIGFLLIIAGVWLFFAPWALGYPFADGANDAHLVETVTGVVVFLVGLGHVLSRARGFFADMLVIASGALLVSAPFVFNYGGEEGLGGARANALAVGVVLILLGLFSFAFGAGARRRRHRELGRSAAGPPR
ncbi:SPW repeat domain-containing protein [Streptomyces aidingensis]|uniref:SPW repeat-containing protein n=1 Tax=Streptomyces aidingensis TaxID=910347 RepID=A0A1I1SKK2_9ACTN|nr:SPW repeat protein [Streptomyces aidingensis]SFD46951.1 SPW repeat-containing protein [Streptomyces aidingensis]